MWSLENHPAHPVDFDEPKAQVVKFLTYGKVTLLVSNGPTTPADGPRYVDELYMYRVRLLVRTNPSSYSVSLLKNTGITALDIPFTHCHVPEEKLLKKFADHVDRLLAEHRRIWVAIQGFEDGPFIIVYALMNLGMSRLEALSKVRECEANLAQLQYLQKFEITLREEMKEKKNKVCTYVKV